MARSAYKGPNIHPSILKKVKENIALSKETGNVVSKYPIYTTKRDSIIFGQMCNMIFHIHDGKKYVKLQIRESMVGKSLGSFVPTRYFPGHKKKESSNVPKAKKKFGR